MMPPPAAACTFVSPVEYLGSAVALAVRFWLASFFLGALILCLDIYERRLSLVLPIAGWVLLLWGVNVYRHAIAQTASYRPDCTIPLLEVAQYVLALMSALFGYRVFRAARPS
jgi:hypothetical protein